MSNNNLDILKKTGTGFKTPNGYFKNIEKNVFTQLSENQLPQEEGFNMPPNYLETVEDKVLTKITVDYTQPNESLNIPDGYFEGIEDRVFSKIQQEDIAEPKVINFRSRLIKLIVPIAVSASVLLILVLNQNENKYSLQDVAASDIEGWIEEDLVTLDSYEIAELYGDVNLEEEFSNDDLDMLNYVNGTDIESVLLTD